MTKYLDLIGLSVRQQYSLLGLTYLTYYLTLAKSTQNLALMQRINRLFTARSELGVERLSVYFRFYNQERKHHRAAGAVVRLSDTCGVE